MWTLKEIQTVLAKGISYASFAKEVVFSRDLLQTKTKED